MAIYIHPAALDTAALLAECEVKRQRRRGPGGQHRNKVETAVVIVHRATGIRGEASETRSQADNQKMAMQRLRVKLALDVRSPIEGSADPALHAVWQGRVSGGQIEVSPLHADFPALLAVALDVLAACEFDFPRASAELSCSNSQLTKFLKVEPAALRQVNAQRSERDLRPLR